MCGWAESRTHEGSQKVSNKINLSKVNYTVLWCTFSRICLFTWVKLIHFMARLEAIGLLFAPFPVARFPITHYNKRDFCTVQVPQGVQSVQLWQCIAAFYSVIQPSLIHARHVSSRLSRPILLWWQHVVHTTHELPQQLQSTSCWHGSHARSQARRCTGWRHCNTCIPLPDVQNYMCVNRFNHSKLQCYAVMCSNWKCQLLQQQFWMCVQKCIH